MTKARPGMLAIAMLLACLPARARGASGVLDPTFGTGGMTLVEVDGEGNFASALQPDGKIVSVGNVGFYPNRRLAAVRYTADGALDGSFGTDGVSFLPASAVVDPQPHGVVVLPDGKLLISASVRTALPNTYASALVRLSSDGSVDTTFGTGGVLVRGTIGFNALALQSDGKVLVGGDVGSDFSHVDFAVARFDANGATDASFGTGGIASADLTSFDFVEALFESADGRIVAVGQTTLGPSMSAFGIVR